MRDIEKKRNDKLNEAPPVEYVNGVYVESICRRNFLAVYRDGQEAEVAQCTWCKAPIMHHGQPDET